MTTRTTTILAAGALGAALLAGCSSGDQGDEAASDSPATASAQAHDHGGMAHSPDGGPVPEGMTVAADPQFPKGSRVTLTADHMEGMDGAPATVVGAYTTYTYAVDYTPTTGGEPVTDHRWVVQEEIRDAGDARLPDGAPVILEADHMEGMQGAEATIARSTDETVYVVDYEADGMTMTNHKWVVESEMQPAP